MVWLLKQYGFLSEILLGGGVNILCQRGGLTAKGAAGAGRSGWWVLGVTEGCPLC